ncbi:hypothetical protein TNCV_4374681 [Trichonephila clavipes]|nr:hypothetical protein TNCV_4374681 [Trichonephila clavipes]
MVIAFGAISGLYGGCIKTSQTSSQGFWRVTTDMCPGAVLMEHNTFFCWPILDVSSQSLASNGPIVDSRNLNVMFGHTKATHNKLFLSSPTKYTRAFLAGNPGLAHRLSCFTTLWPQSFSHNIFVSDPFHHPQSPSV